MDYPRFNNWQDRLDAYIAKHERQPFDWQANNCSTFATEWVRIATGRVMEVPATPNCRHALRAVQNIGGLYADVCRQLGDSVPGTFARVGDFVLLDLPRSRGRASKALGVCLGALVAGQGPDGLVMVPITQAEAAWRV